MIYKLTNRYGWFVFLLSCFQRALHSARGSLASWLTIRLEEVVSWRATHHLPGWSHRVKLERVLFCVCRARAGLDLPWFCFFFVFFYHRRNILFPMNPNAADTPKWPRRQPTDETRKKKKIWSSEDMFWAIAAAETPQHARTRDSGTTAGDHAVCGHHHWGCLPRPGVRLAAVWWVFIYGLD